MADDSEPLVILMYSLGGEIVRCTVDFVFIVHVPAAMSTRSRSLVTIGLASSFNICASVCVSAFESVSVVVSVVTYICDCACVYVLLYPSLW
jgi:hypothetical protein